MSKENLAYPVDRAALSEHYKQVESFQRSRARSAQRISKAMGAVAGVAILGNLAQALTIAALVPLTRLVPVYLWVRPDGTVDSSISLSRLPATQSQAVINTALWEYVRLREGFSSDTARYAFDIVSGMSTPVVRNAYQAFFNYPNPVSPQVTVGTKGTIEIEHIASADLSDGVQQIRYRRILRLNGGQPLITTWTATVQFATVGSLPIALRLQNPGGVVITSYQSAEDSIP
ncbi:MAG: type IV secretion system protein VirB8 [Janthinobacterium lividum]